MRPWRVPLIKAYIYLQHLLFLLLRIFLQTVRTVSVINKLNISKPIYLYYLFIYLGLFTLIQDD